MKLTIEELRKVYEEAESLAWCAMPEDRSEDFDEYGYAHGCGLLAVARFVAERQRAVEPTVSMCFAGGDAIGAIGCSGSQIDHRAEALVAYRAMSAVAPLVVPE